MRAARLAGEQDGLLSRADLVALGLTRDQIAHRAATGRLHRRHRGVYALGHLALPPRAPLRAALMAVPGAVLALDAAAFLLDFGPAVTAPVDVIVAPGRQVRRTDVRVHRCRLHAGEEGVAHGLAVTSPARTLLDLAGRSSRSELEQRLGEAFARRRVGREALVAVLDAHPGARGSALLRRLVDHDVHRTRSHPERTLLRLIRQAGLPAPQVNAREGRTVPDLVWDALGLVVEIDGYAFHSAPGAFVADRRRDRAQHHRGRTTLRIAAAELDESPLLVLADVARAVERAAAAVGSGAS